MPSLVINTHYEAESEKIFFELHLELEAIDSVTKTSQAVFQSKFEFAAIGDPYFIDLAIFESGFIFESFGFLNAEPNITDEVILQSSFEFLANGNTFTEALALFDAHFDFSAVESVREAEVSSLSLIVDIIPERAASSNYIHQQGRLKVDGVEVPFVSASYSEADGRAGSELSIQLARLSDRLLITPNAVIEFAIGNKSSGAWTDVEVLLNTLASNGVDKTTFSLAYENNAPKDVFSFSSVSDASSRFSRSPRRSLVLYDPLRVSINATEFQPIYDTNGLRYDVELVPIIGLSLYSMLSQVLENRCGFTSVNTNLPNFPIQRVDCPVGQSYMDAVAGYIGMYEPDIYEVEPGALWIEDSTNTLPSGFPDPKSIEIDSWVNATKTSQHQKIDALLVSYTEDARNFDYETTRSEVTIEETGTGGTLNYTSTFREKFFREYRKFSNPTLVIASKIERETTSTTNFYGYIIAETDERRTHDNQGRITRRTKVVRSVVPTLPSDDPQTYYLADVSSETERMEYQQVPFRLKETYLSKRVLDTYGAVIYDPDNKQLDKDYFQSAVDALRSGNVSSSSVLLVYVALKSVVETTTPNADGTVSIKLNEIDHLNGISSNSISEDRAGDVGLRSTSSSQKTILVFDSDVTTPSFDRIQGFSAGELPVELAVDLARRYLIKKKTKSNTVQFTKIGFDKSVKRGSLYTVNERGTSPIRSLGIYKIKGRTITADRSGVFMSLNGTQV